jgi:hypothetical protein
MDPKTERAKKIASLASQLRVAFANAADESAVDRQDYVQEVLRRELAGVPPDERDVIVRELLTHFPTLELGDMAPVASPRAEGGRGEPIPTDPLVLADLLAKATAKLGDGDKAAVLARLEQGGFAMPKAAASSGGSGGGGEVPEAVARLIRTKLGIGEKEPVDAARLMELAGGLTEFLLSLDRLVWQAWGNVAANSTVRRREQFQRTAAQMVMGRPDAPLTSVTQDTDRLRQLTLAMVAAISKSGSMFAQRWLEKYGVEAIRVAATPRKKLTESFDATCWRLYVEQAGLLDQSQITEQINQTIAEFVEGLMKAGR